MKKSKEAKREAAEAAAKAHESAQRAEECQRLLDEAIQEEAQIIEDAKARIKAICEEHSLFCGVILSVDDIAPLVKLMVRSQDTVSIEFSLHPIETP